MTCSQPLGKLLAALGAKPTPIKSFPISACCNSSVIKHPDNKYECEVCGNMCNLAEWNKEKPIEKPRVAVPEIDLLERIAQITAHRVCCGSEHNPAIGKFHGHCVVCGIPFPCEYVGKPPTYLHSKE